MRILLGIGGSPDSRTALEATLARVDVTGDHLTVGLLAEADSDATVDELETLVDEAAAKHDLDPDIVIIEGDPGPTLTTLAAEQGYDRIVIGGGKRSPMGKIALGDITEFVVLNADTTVTLIR